MNRHFIALLFLGLTFNLGRTQNPEDISFGLSGRSEQNLYRYYADKTVGDFNTIRVHNGYSAGLAIRSTINFLFNFGVSMGFSEVSYAPSIKKDNSILWNTHLRLWQYDIWGELKLGNKQKSHTVVMLGMQVLSIYRKTENFSNGEIAEYAWPQSRTLPKIGLGYDMHLGKKGKWQLEPYIGARLALKNKLGYDYALNQFYVGLNITRKIKTW